MVDSIFQQSCSGQVVHIVAWSLQKEFPFQSSYIPCNIYIYIHNLYNSYIVDRLCSWFCLMPRTWHNKTSLLQIYSRNIYMFLLVRTTSLRCREAQPCTGHGIKECNSVEAHPKMDQSRYRCANGRWLWMFYSQLQGLIGWEKWDCMYVLFIYINQRKPKTLEDDFNL